MEHEQRDIACLSPVGANVEGTQRLAVGCRDEEFFEVGYAKLGRAGYVGARVGREVSCVDQFTAKVSHCLSQL